MMKKKQKGQSTLEFALFIPVVIIFVFTFLEVGLYFMVQQKITALAREAGYRAFKYCQTSPSLESCVEGVLAEVVEEAERTISEFDTRGQVLISAYSWAGAASRDVCEASSGVCASDTHFDSSNLNMAEGVAPVFVGEIIYDYTPFFEGISGTILPDEIHDYAAF